MSLILIVINTSTVGTNFKAALTRMTTETKVAKLEKKVERLDL